MALERPLPTVARDVIPADHPCLPGHFPGMPIVPGVVLLERVAEACAAAGGNRLSGLVEAKFLRPVRPEQPFTIALERPTDGSAAFEIRNNEGVLVRGRLRVEPAA